MEWGKSPLLIINLIFFTIMTHNEEITEEEKIRLDEEEKNSIDPNNEEDDSIAIN